MMRMIGRFVSELEFRTRGVTNQMDPDFGTGSSEVLFQGARGRTICV